MAKTTATARADECKRQASNYLRAVIIARDWKQTQIADVMGIKQSNVSRALRGLQIIDLPKLMVLAGKSRVPLPEELTEAYKALSMPVSAPHDIAVLHQIAELGQQLTKATDAREVDAIREQMKALLAKSG